MFGDNFFTYSTRLLHSGDLDDMQDAILCEPVPEAERDLAFHNDQKEFEDRIVPLKRCA